MKQNSLYEGSTYSAHILQKYRNHFRILGTKLRGSQDVRHHTIKFICLVTWRPGSVFPVTINYHQSAVSKKTRKCLSKMGGMAQ